MYEWSPQALHLTNAGVGNLAELGFAARTPRHATHFIHQLTQNQTAADFEVAFRERLITWRDILAAPSTPKAGTSFPVRFSFKGKDYNYNLTPDGAPFGIAYPNDTYRFCVFETDCASEPLTSSNRDRQTIETKFAAYLSVLEMGTYQSHLGLPNLTVLFTTTTRTRAESMIALLASMDAPQKLKRCFGFQVFPTILQKQPDAG